MISHFMSNDTDRFFFDAYVHTLYYIIFASYELLCIERIQYYIYLSIIIISVSPVKRHRGVGNKTVKNERQ